TRADEEAIAIFGKNLEQLLLAPPAGERVVIGLDPGFRTGVKVAAVSRTGAVLATDTFFLHQTERFAQSLLAFIARFDAELISIGNGTASRETEQLVRDPLAELVKIDPKSIGVGQYQHDVSQPRLKQRLDEVVESCVNRVGVEVNTASASLLSYVAGIGPSLAANIVKTRDERGGFRSRKDLTDVPRLGAKAFEQAAGFLRVRGGTHVLDASAVHPERYRLVERMAGDLGCKVGELMGNEVLHKKLD